MKRLVTGIIGSAVALFAIFGLPEPAFYLFCLLLFLVAAGEFHRIGQFWAPELPRWPLLGAIGLLSFAFCWPELAIPPALGSLGQGLALGAALVLFCSLAVLFGRGPVAESLSSMSMLAFGALYFAVPLAAAVALRRQSPWVLLLAAAIIWIGDAVALYAGRAFGRKKFAPVISPNKTWVGAVASLLSALAVTAAWGWWRLGSVEVNLLLVGVLTSCAGQAGDLVESMLKRGAGVKDSGNILPGHGGLYDRLDALLLGAPVMWLGQQLIQ
ncbi:MAG: phosphatidate cytidylyltransferase [Deltaproteobacteria bacterium]|nr:phosphatidate cytidylyltransferase [Deltaproteobacteria bacterium]